MESSTHSDYHHLFRLATSVFHAPAHTHTHTHTHTRTHIPQIPNYKEQRSVRRCLIKTTDQLTAQLAWLIRGSVGTKARSPLLSLSLSVSLSLSLSFMHTYTCTLLHSHPLTGFERMTWLSLNLATDQIILLNRQSRIWLKIAWKGG